MDKKRGRPLKNCEDLKSVSYCKTKRSDHPVKPCEVKDKTCKSKTVTKLPGCTGVLKSSFMDGKKLDRKAFQNKCKEHGEKINQPCDLRGKSQAKVKCVNTKTKDIKNKKEAKQGLIGYIP
jgi:hypothetical protein